MTLLDDLVLHGLSQKVTSLSTPPGPTSECDDDMDADKRRSQGFLAKFDPFAPSDL